MTNPYSELVSNYSALLKEIRVVSPAIVSKARSRTGKNSPTALIFSPHPDDEVIMGGLALRLLREANWNVVNVAVTTGSKQSRRKERLQELRRACGSLQFGFVVPGATGLEEINLSTRTNKSQRWAKAVKAISKILLQHPPRVIFLPHDDDGHAAHIGTHHLVMDALAQYGSKLECYIVETEFWRHMTKPNLLVEIPRTDVADLMLALSMHVGEVKRNPYHLTLPAWMIDNVRRTETVTGHGTRRPGFSFGILYRLRLWRRGRLVEVQQRGKILTQKKNPARLFE